MSEITILKNKKITLKAEFGNKKIGEETHQNIALTLTIKNGDQEVIYGSDEQGFAINDKGSRRQPDISLDKLAKDEKQGFYKGLLQNKYSEIENLVILSGAGSSVGQGVGDVRGLTMAGLWDKMEKDQGEVLKALMLETKYDLQWPDKTLKKDLEILLSRAGMKNAVEGNLKLKENIDAARDFIIENCSLSLPVNAPHAALLHKAILRPQKFPRVKIFTLNYDTLFEQAAANEKFTVMDGFTFSSPRVFNGKYFDYDIIETRHNRQDSKDSTISKLFYLFKIHGSLTWERKGGEIEQNNSKIELENRVIIFPQASKYEHTYEQPYFEMMARLQQAMRKENTLLITIGFSFFDKHISSVILESLKQNPSLHLIAVTYPVIVGADEEHQKELHRITDLQSRVTLIGESFEEFARVYPENSAHQRIDVLEELNDGLKKLTGNVPA